MYTFCFGCTVNNEYNIFLFQFERSICSSTTIYNININTNQELLLNQTMSTADCMSSSDKYCSIQLFVNDTTEVYHVLVTARNLGNFRNNFTSYTVIGMLDFLIDILFSYSN